jgi:hypothetical protein
LAKADTVSRIEFSLVIGGSWDGSAISIAIDGRGLRDIVARIEGEQRGLRGGWGRGGGYLDLPLGELRASVREHLLGEPGFRHGLSEGINEGKSLLLICTCGEYGCQALAVRIEVEARSVVWRHASNVNQPWSYPALNERRFDRHQYLHEISRLEREIDEAAAVAAFGGWRPDALEPGW